MERQSVRLVPWFPGNSAHEGHGTTTPIYHHLSIQCARSIFIYSGADKEFRLLSRAIMASALGVL